MDEEEAALVLLQTELNSIQGTIRGLDTTMYQIKGWCVTASLALAGFAVTKHQHFLLLVGVGAIVGFWLVDCQVRSIQVRFIRRNQAIKEQLDKAGIKAMLQAIAVEPVGTAANVTQRQPISLRNAGIYAKRLLAEGFRPVTSLLYVFILCCLGLEALLLVA